MKLSINIIIWYWIMYFNKIFWSFFCNQYTNWFRSWQNLIALYETKWFSFYININPIKIIREVASSLTEVTLYYKLAELLIQMSLFCFLLFYNNPWPKYHISSHYNSSKYFKYFSTLFCIFKQILQKICFSSSSTQII